MIPARHTWFHVRFFRWYTDYRIRRNFSTVSVHGTLPGDYGKPLLIVANHFSWWDGFFILWLNKHYLKKQFHVMMLEDQLRKNMILNKTGAFSIKKGNRSMVESLNYARDILLKQKTEDGRRKTEDKRRKTKDGRRKSDEDIPMVLMYPQGEIQSMHARPLKFEKGLEHVIRGLEGKINILMAVVLIDYFSSQKPRLHFYLDLFPFNQEPVISDLESAYNHFLTDSLNQHTGTLAH